MVARQIIMNMLFLDRPLSMRNCMKFFQNQNEECVAATNPSEHREPLEQMQRLSILMVKDEEVYMNDVFRRGMIGALTGRYVQSLFITVATLSPLENHVPNRTTSLCRSSSWMSTHGRSGRLFCISWWEANILRVLETPCFFYFNVRVSCNVARGMTT